MNLREVICLSWTQELYKVYENNCGRADNEPPLLPISHITANAQIELTISEHGDFISAARVEKADNKTIIPVTVDSGSRSSGIAPHPFADKLIYLAGDYAEWVENLKPTYGEYHEKYMKALSEWRSSEFSHAAVNALYTYLCKAEIMKDLVCSKALISAEDSTFINNGPKIEGILQPDCFVRIRVLYSDKEKESRTWLDSTLYDCFIRFNSRSMGENQLCYATGRLLPLTYKHPQKIRNAGDKSKLFSANDESGFTFKGRFDTKEQAFSISYDFSEKMHNALRWLIQKQGLTIGSSLVYVAWESSLKPLPKITSGSDEIFESLGFNFGEEAKEEAPATDKAYKSLLARSIMGYKSHLDKASKAMLMLLDAATPGRLSISMYTELAASDFLENIEKWHGETSWMRYNSERKKSCISSFNMRDIANCAFGTETGSFVECKPEVQKETILRLIPCVTEGRRIPKDIVRNLVYKASSPLNYSKSNNFNKVLETACGMIRKTIIEDKGECEMALDLENRDRSYLFGRLLAIADKAESDSYDKPGERTTNAKRYWSAFASRPYQTWKIIEERLRPYLDKNEYSSKFTKLIDEIMSELSFEDFTSRDKLAPSYLLGYHCQMQEFYKQKNKEKE